MLPRICLTALLALVLLAAPAEAGVPATNCCTAHAGPGCDVAACEAAACLHPIEGGDPFCCSEEGFWDDICANVVAPRQCPTLCGTGLTSTCCFANGGTGCDDSDCQTAVCAIDDFCCTTTWDGVCADTAAQECRAMCVGLDDFICYKVKQTKGTEKFVPRDDQLDDAYEDKFFTSRKVAALCSPSNTAGTGALHAANQLLAYQLKEARGTTKHTKVVDQVANVFWFNDIFFDTSKVDRLLVPSAQDLSTPVPELTAPRSDHFKCYKVREDKARKFGGSEIGVGDFFTGSRSLAIGKPRWVCLPADKNNEGILNSQWGLVCFSAKPGQNQQKHLKVPGVHTNNQFGPGQWDTVKEEAFCTPARISAAP